jgi:hypothetical protein
MWIIVWTKRNGVDRYAKLVQEEGEKPFLVPRNRRSNATEFKTYDEAEDAILNDSGSYPWLAREE